MKNDLITVLLVGLGIYVIARSSTPKTMTQQDTTVTQQDILAASKATHTYVNTPLGSVENDAALQEITKYADHVKAAGGTNADVINSLSSGTMTPDISQNTGSGFVDNTGSYVPAVNNTPQVRYGQYTSAPSTAAVTKNAQGGFNIKL